MKILANRKIKFLFCSILSCILVFVLISTVLVNLDVRNTVYYIIFCSVCMGAAILLFCYGYFKEQHKIMENAISQITEYISGNKEVTIECNDEGELYRLFHEVNSLVAILNAHAENEKSAKKFLRNTISDISHQLKTPLAALNIYNGIIQGEAKELPTICIILAVFLVTSIFSMVEMWTKAETTAMRHNHGDWHIALQNIQDNEAEQIRKDNDVAFSSWYDSINANAEQDYYIGGKNAVIYGIEEAYSTNIMNYPTEGNYPQNEKEVVLSADAKELFGVKVGDSITLNTHAGDLGYTITGFYQDDSEFNSMVNGICVYVNRDTFNHIRSLNGETSASQFYIRFQNENRLKKTIADFKLKYNLTDENVKENMAVLSMLGASSNDSINQLYPLAAICFVIILISGVFMISSCMNSTVAQRTKFFGMMRCIGASKKQIIHFVRLEALNWCKTAIPIGCILGTITCWILCAILRFLVKGEWADMPLFSVSVTGILCGAVVGIVTVFIAAHSPAKQAAKVSPVAAVSGNTGTSKHGGCAAKSGVFKIETSLGIHHATEAKKNLFLITGSFALTIALFLSFAACLDLVHKLLPSVSDFTPDIVISSEDETNSVDRNLAEDISEIPGVKSVFGTKLHVAYPVEINGNAGTVDLFSYDESMLDSFKKSVMSGDLSKVYGNSGYALAIYNQDNRLNVGDKIKIGDTEIEIACIASEGVGSVSGAATMVCSEETYTQLTGEQDYALVSVVLEKNISETEVSKIRNLSSDYVFADNRAENSDVNGSYWVFRLAAYGFLAIISFITILNIMNSISMSVSARIKQYGAMRAVGMGNRQITKMITAEAITYAACGTIIGFVLGLLLHYLIYVKIIVTHFGGTWKVPVVPMEIIVLLVLVSCILAVYAPAKRIRNMAITATINEL